MCRHRRTFHLHWPGAALLAVWLAGSQATAVTIEHIDVEKHGQAFRLKAASVVAAPPEFVFDVLMDFDNFHRLVAGIVTTRYLPPGPDGVRLGYTLINSCAWIFCKRFDKVERIWPVPKTGMVTLAVPERSDFEFYATRWRLEGVPGGTRLRFEANMRPKFWIPPLLGTWAVKRKLVYTAEEMGEVVEYLYSTGTKLSELPDSPGQR
jgi:hypothetical protein